MGVAPLHLTTFNGGEVGPDVYGRVDIAKYRDSASLLQNMVPLVEGGVTRRPGTRYLGTAKATTVRLLPFTFNTTQSYILEFTDQAVRFYMNGGQLADATSGLAYEIATPYLADELADLQYAQANDVMYITHPNHVPRRLTRSGHTDWALTELVPLNGPFMDENTTTTTIYASAATGTVTLIATPGVFDGDMVGGLFRLDEETLTEYSSWEPSKSYAVGDEARYAENVYQCISAGTSGATAPVHLEGSAWDGTKDASAEWLYQHSGHGIVQIEAVAASTTATATVVGTLPAGVVGATNATATWREGAWSTLRGYPAAVNLYEQRLVLARSSAEPQRFWTSVGGNFEDFTVGDLADDSVFTDVNSRQANPIFAIGDGAALIMLTGRRAYPYMPLNTATIQPDSLQRGIPVDEGASAAQPLTVDGRLLYVSVDGRRLIDLDVNEMSGRLVAVDRTLLARHVGEV